METSLFVAVGILNYSVSKMHVDNLAGIVQSRISAKVILAKGSSLLLLWKLSVFKTSFHLQNFNQFEQKLFELCESIEMCFVLFTNS